MTPKDKALNLVTRYASINITTLGCGAEEGNPCIISNVMFKLSAKECALIAVDEIIQSFNDVMIPNPFNQYWQEVKKEIENL